MQRPTLGLTAAESRGGVGAGALAPTHPTVKDSVIQTELGTTQGSAPRRDIISLGFIRTFLAEKGLQGTLEEVGGPDGQLLRWSKYKWGYPSQGPSQA